MLQHLHAGYDVETAGRGGEHLLGSDHAVVDIEPLAGGVQAGDFDHSRREIDASHSRSRARERFAQQSSAAADIEDPRACQRDPFRNEARPHRVQQMQRTKLTARIPETAGERVEFPELTLVGIRYRAHAATPMRIRSAH